MFYNHNCVKFNINLFLRCRYGDQETCEFLTGNTVPITEPTPPISSITPEPTEQPTTEPPTTQNPATDPPTTVTEPPTTQSPATEPPTTQTPTTVTEPPTTPPTTEPPTTQPATEPSTTQASATNPPTTSTEVSPTTEFNPCEGIQNGYIADEENCAMFYRCVMGR